MGGRVKAAFPWPNNLNPACTPSRRCGHCRRDALSAAARGRWQRNVFRPETRWDAWSPEEIAVVRLFAGTMHPRAIARELAARRLPGGKMRTVSGVRVAASEYGISLARAGYSTPQLALVFGCSSDHIGDWIESGYLQAHQWDPSRARTAWVVTEADAEAFVRDYPWIYDLGMMDRSHRLFAVARAAQRGEQWLSASELGLRLGLTGSHVAELARRGVFAGQRRGTFWMFRASLVPEMRAMLARRRNEHVQFLRTCRLKHLERAA